MGEMAFYAPLKPPGHPQPSGDRTVARGLIAALELGLARKVRIVSDLRTREGAGDPARQSAIRTEAEAEIARLRSELAGRVALWVTYHNYYKAPDLLGPALSGALGIPYVLIEATRARKRLTGPWAGFAQAAEAASDQASVIFHFTERDRETLERDRPPGQRLVALRPFLPREDMPPQTDGRGLLAAGMMREGDKLASYEILAQALRHLRTPGWRLDIAGDGPARAAVKALMDPFGPRVRFLGQLDAAGMAEAYGQADVFVWPGVNEAFGMVYLEAQAAGLAVAAQDRPGMREVLLAGTHPAPEAGPDALAARIDGLLSDPAAARAEGEAARAAVARGHLMGAAAATLRGALAPLLQPGTTEVAR